MAMAWAMTIYPYCQRILNAAALARVNDDAVVVIIAAVLDGGAGCGRDGCQHFAFNLFHVLSLS